MANLWQCAWASQTPVVTSHLRETSSFQITALKVLLCLCGLLAVLSSTGQVVQGVVLDENQVPLPFASVYVENSSNGTSSNRDGQFELRLSPGTWTLVFGFVGYADHRETVTLQRGDVHKLRIGLQKATNAIGAVDIVADARDRAKEIMREVRDRRPTHFKAVQQYSCTSYVQTSLVSESRDFLDFEALDIRSTTLDSAGIDVPEREHTDLLETFSVTQFRSPGQYAERIIAQQTFNDNEIRDDPGRSMSMGAGIDLGFFDDLDPSGFQSYRNPFIIYEDALSCSFNFYRNDFSFDAICQKPMLSPIAASGPLSYRYAYIGLVYEAGKAIYEIEVTPLNKGEPLWEGRIFVQDSSYALVAVDLRLNRSALSVCSDLQIVQRYSEPSPGIWLPDQREVRYTIPDGTNVIRGNTTVRHSGYAVNVPLPDSFSATEIKQFDPEAFDRDSAFWANRRPLSLRDGDLDFMLKSDSVRRWYESDEWLRRVDSTFNRVDLWTPLIGYGYRNRVRGIELYVEGLVAQVNPFGIGGYRHRLPGSFKKEFDNGLLLETEGFVDYGFRNQDVKGRGFVGLTYVPLKFIRTRLLYGDYYDLINDFASFEQIFSRSNYVRNTEYGIFQRMEIVNGLFGELGFVYSDQRTIADLELANWSLETFGELNTPIDFERYLKSELSLRLKYRIRQQYQIRKGRKEILGSKYPSLELVYRKGIPGLFSSEVNYDYLELGATHNVELARLGNSRWKVAVGTYLNKRDLRVLEHKYFRGSDRFFFSDPLRSFQLLGPTLSTPNEWIQANYIHHFEGALLGKVPLINRTKITTVAGGGVLSIPGDGFYHTEVFAGLERAVRIRGELVRFSVLGVTASNTLENPVVTVKVGASFFNSWLRTWDY